MLKFVGMLAVLLSTAPLAASPLPTLEPHAEQERRPGGSKAVRAKGAQRPSVRKGKPVTIDGQEYRTLDEYLARLERDGWVGKPWYREVRPGVYELVTNLKPPPANRMFTRIELERKFGFAR